MTIALLVIALFSGLFIIPLGLPGTWVMIAAAVAYSLLVPGSIGWGSLVAIALLALVAEVLEFTLGASYTKKYGGSSRASWGAVLGGLVGAFVGVPVLIVGPIIGGFMGAFAGALAAEFSRGSSIGASATVATGAIIGRGVAAAMKVAVGLVIAAWVVVAAIG